MRISELIGYKQNPAYAAAKELGNYNFDDFPNITSYQQNVENRVKTFIKEIEKLGYKLEHIGWGVYSNVFKRSGDPYVIKIFTDDHAYLKYVAYCLQHQDNPHVPKFRGKLIKITPNTYAVRLEQLRNFRKTQSLTDVIYHDITEKPKTWGNLSKDPHIKSYSPQLSQLFTDLSGIFGDNYYPDMHSGNIMMRGLTLVVIDV